MSSRHATGGTEASDPAGTGPGAARSLCRGWEPAPPGAPG
jgi:hypothetical protein